MKSILATTMGFGGVGFLSVFLADVATANTITAAGFKEAVGFGSVAATFAWFLKSQFTKVFSNHLLLHENQLNMKKAIEQVAQGLAVVESHCRNCAARSKPKTDYTTTKIDLDTPVRPDA